MKTRMRWVYGYQPGKAKANPPASRPEPSPITLNVWESEFTAQIENGVDSDTAWHRACEAQALADHADALDQFLQETND